MSLTPFQEAYVRQVEAGIDFLQWCVHPSELRPGLVRESADIIMNQAVPVPRPPLLFTFWTIDGVLHAHRVGKTQVMACFTFPPTAED